MRRSTIWSILLSSVMVVAVGVVSLSHLSVCQAQTGTANSQRLRATQSKYYTIHSNARQAEVDFVKRYMDMLFETYQQRFSEFKRRDNSSMNLYLFDDREGYQQFLVRQKLGVASTSGGVFFVNENDKGLATYIESRDPEWTLQTLRHEGFHQFAYAYIGPNLPLWVNEGLAEYFGEGIVVRGKIMPGIIPQRRLFAVRQAIAQRTAFDFPELIAMTSDRWQHLMETRPDHGAMLYNQSWSMVQFLIHADNGRYAQAFGQYLTLLAQGIPSVRAFEQAFGATDSSLFRRRWEEYMASVQPDPLSSSLDDLRFLAMGLRLLAEQKDAPKARSFPQLKRVLQQGSFYVVQQGHGQNFRLEASDHDLFTYTLPNGETKPYLMLEPARNDLPPRLVAPGLRPEPTINWTRNEKNQLVFRIDFK